MRVNWFVERFCVFLMVILVLDVWLGILVRYLFPVMEAILPDVTFQATWTEELARYLMIWMALLAVSSGIAHREHIGVLFVFEKFPPSYRRWLALSFDLLAFAFFALIFYYGIGFVERGMTRFTMIYEMPKGYPNIGIPLSAAMACVQLALVSVRDFIMLAPTATDKPAHEV
jgi:TRAP-type C4-dicarboxylate transport system permease small subunit